MANALANQGADIVVLARRKDKIEVVAKELAEKYGVEGELDTAAVFLASPMTTYVNGLNLPVDGGYTCV